ncbi:MAG: hypothetical protein HY815_10690 [Candidatus Riflebacteria bacterium]|nr:hypothetical protein [Candidatus Riflebacteria bacterium]
MNRFAVWIAVLMIGLAMVNGVARSLAAEFHFKQETDVSLIFQTFGSMGRFNVMVSPLVRQQISLSLKGVEPVDAMNQVAKMCNLAVVAVKLAQGSTETYLVVPQGKTVSPKLPAGVESSSVADLVFKQHVPVSQIVSTVAVLGRFNALVDPTVRVSMRLALRGVRPLEAVFLIAALLGLTVEEARSGNSVTYILKPAVATPQR